VLPLIVRAMPLLWLVDASWKAWRRRAHGRTTAALL
jgi:hypothetical protein